MKRMMILLLALAMALQLAACARVERLKDVELPPLPTVTVKPEATIAPVEVPAAPVETPAPQESADGESAEEAMRQSVIVNFRKTAYTEFDPANGEQQILDFSYVTPHVTIPGREAAADAINEYIAMLDESYYTGNDYGDGVSDGYNGFLEQALDNFSYVHETGADMPLEFFSERTAEVPRADGRVLSLYFNTSTYTGGAHGIYVGSAYVFDTETGSLLSLDRITPDYEAFSALVVEKMLEQAHADADLSAAISSFIEEKDWAFSFARLLREGSWYLDENGLVLFSTLYELAPYAAGIQSFTVSYEELGELLDPRYRVGDRQAEGGFTFLRMSQVEEGSVPVLDFVQAAQDAEQLCLISGERVYDVTLSRVGYLEEENTYYKTEILWFCSVMQNEAVQLSANLVGADTQLLLSYRSGDGQHRALLSLSAEDGSPRLVEDGFTLYE